ncbi:MAG: hypothetical protein AAB589_03105 [Patescibacteria group bacterium]
MDEQEKKQLERQFALDKSDVGNHVAASGFCFLCAVWMLWAQIALYTSSQTQETKVALIVLCSVVMFFFFWAGAGHVRLAKKTQKELEEKST